MLDGPHSRYNGFYFQIESAGGHQWPRMTLNWLNCFAELVLRGPPGAATRVRSQSIVASSHALYIFHSVSCVLLQTYTMCQFMYHSMLARQDCRTYYCVPIHFATCDEARFTPSYRVCSGYRVAMWASLSGGRVHPNPINQFAGASRRNWTLPSKQRNSIDNYNRKPKITRSI